MQGRGRRHHARCAEGDAQWCWHVPIYHDWCMNVSSTLQLMASQTLLQFARQQHFAQQCWWHASSLHT
eukprot:6177740-Pleurochrysis_carterae.AAC.1